MKTNGQIMTERELLAKMDELRRLEETLDWFLSLVDDLVRVIMQIETTDPEVAELLWKVYRPLDRKVDEVWARTSHLADEIDRLYADLLVQEADANESIPPAMQVMLPPYLERALFENKMALQKMS